MVDKAPIPPWNGAAVRAWLGSRVVAARADQVAAERKGYAGQDDCDIAAAEEMVCATLGRGASADELATFLAALKTLLDRDDYAWRGVYDDRRFDRHVRAYLRKLTKMAKTNAGFDKLSRFQ